MQLIILERNPAAWSYHEWEHRAQYMDTICSLCMLVNIVIDEEYLYNFIFFRAGNDGVQLLGLLQWRVHKVSVSPRGKKFEAIVINTHLLSWKFWMDFLKMAWSFLRWTLWREEERTGLTCAVSPPALIQKPLLLHYKQISSENDREGKNW